MSQGHQTREYSVSHPQGAVGTFRSKLTSNAQHHRLDQRGIAKLGDFGVSHIFEEELEVEEDPIEDEESDISAQGLTRQDTESYLSMSGMSHQGLLTRTEGTWCFWSPEMCQGSRCFSGYAADLWAAGICLYILCTGRLPFYSEVPTELLDQIVDGDVPYAGHGLSNTLVDLLKGTLEKDPSKRAGVGDCLKHPFLQVAREQRIRQLSFEFNRSNRRHIVVGDEDIKSAFRIVTNIPVMLLKTATKQIQESFQAARERLSMASSISPSPPGSFNNGSGIRVSKKESWMSTDSSEGGGSCLNDKLEVVPDEQQHDMDVSQHHDETEGKDLANECELCNDDGLCDEKKVLNVKRRRRSSDEKCVIQ